MPRFYFDFHRPGDICLDHEGVEFADAEQAYLEAYQAAVEMWGDMLAKRRNPMFCHFEILSEDRQLLFVLPMREIIDSCQDRRPAQNIAALLHNSLTNQAAARRARDALVEEIRSTMKTLRESKNLLAQDF